MPSKDTFPFRANRARMKREFNAQAKIGKYGKTGLDRVAFTPVYNEVRDLVEGWMKNAGLKTRVDAVGNLYGRKEGRVRGLPAVMAGSHLDSQSPGGRFDGPAGVLTALEAVRRIGEAGLVHDHPIEVVAFVGEESACGMTVFGSSVATGVIGVKELKNTVHPPTGKSLYKAIEAVGGSPARTRSCRIKQGSLKAFLELHIEQGPVLETAEVPIGVVDRVVGYTRGEVHFTGVTAHSGGQPMPYRKDAGIAAADFMVRMESAVNRAPESQRVTITFGEMEAHPGWVSIVPGGARLSFDLRSKNQAVMERTLARMGKTLAAIEKERGVKGRLSDVKKLAVCPASNNIQRALRRASKETGHASLTLSSGGVHDACRMAEICPMGMVFIPSVGGLSHTPEEFTHFDDMVKGAEILASAIAHLCKEKVKA
ncbi:MAG: M20 family metallo-hydrolase [Nitrospinae bacterium]|nr:M20 family metallo-hydrolase [Nitrospinota bacterium]